MYKEYIYLSMWCIPQASLLLTLLLSVNVVPVCMKLNSAQISHTFVKKLYLTQFHVGLWNSVFHTHNQRKCVAIKGISK